MPLSSLAIDAPPAQQPPGTEALTQMLSWGAWGVSFACLLGVFAVAGAMALAHRRGEEGGAHLGRLGWVLGAAVIGAAAGPLVTALS